MIIEKMTGHLDRVFNIYIWADVEAPKAVVQIVHGVSEHIERYSNFAEFLNHNGYIVVGSDLRGHGKTALEDNSLGWCRDSDPYNNNVSDQIMLTKMLKERYDLPTFAFGHSYGSFIMQAYLQRSGENLAGVVLSGSAKQSGFLLQSGIAIAKLQAKICDKNKPAKLIAGMIFKPYERQVRRDCTKNAWLSRDLKECEKYNNDPLCGQIMSIDFYRSMFCGINELYRVANMQRVNKTLPIYLVSGDRDAVGGNGKLITNLYKEYLKVGVNKVTLKLHKGMRHEILNEEDRDEALFGILSFFNDVLEG